MSAFETAFAAWLMFINYQGADLEPQLLPPAQPTELAELSETIGYELPDDFIELYQKANGQLEPYWEDKSFTGTYSPLFGWYDFIPLEKVLFNYQEQASFREDILPEIYEVDVRRGDPVAAVQWQPGWVPFAVSNAAYYGVDLTPPRGGTYGQVIEFGHDTTENRVLASSITEFLQLALKNLDPNEPHRYEISKAVNSETHDRHFDTLFFDMDWTRTPEPPADPADYQPNPEMDAWNAANHAAVDAFTAWLGSRGYSHEELDVFKRWTFEMHMPMSMKMGGLLAPPMPNDNPMPFGAFSGELYEFVSLELALRATTNYTVEELPVSLEQAFTLLNEYRLEMGLWSQEKFDTAARVISRERPARPSMMDEAATASFSSVDVQEDGSLLLCTDTYTEDGEQIRDCEVFKL